jgi:hypothetical protein
LHTIIITDVAKKRNDKAVDVVEFAEIAKNVEEKL